MGTFDGQGHTVSGIYIVDTTGTYLALFGYADAATIKNVNVANSYIKGRERVAGILQPLQRLQLATARLTPYLNQPEIQMIR